MHAIWTWFLDFIGVNNGYDSFSTHMYNFWSGLGSNLSALALGGTAFGIYRHNLKRLDVLNPLHLRRRRGTTDADGGADDAAGGATGDSRSQ